MGHEYGGVTHTQPGPFEDCLLCRLEAVEQAVVQESLRDGYVRWLLDRDPEFAARLIARAEQREAAAALTSPEART